MSDQVITTKGNATATTDRIEYAGASWYARQLIPSGEVHWFYGPRLRPGVEKALAWCDIRENHTPVFIDAEQVGATPGNAAPCATCAHLAPLPTRSDR
ncbi:hypothetical protein ACIA5G_19355 [Amycolatopsis sp. NPDC051758]|uniref:hypothetical protein n=1 Tax=Amycolatopsis sp. NPDC051758 TaxID=3363935 RepID=UPI0037AFB130